jgi:hypothetical protein
VFHFTLEAWRIVGETGEVFSLINMKIQESNFVSSHKYFCWNINKGWWGKKKKDFKHILHQVCEEIDRLYCLFLMGIYMNIQTELPKIGLLLVHKMKAVKERHVTDVEVHIMKVV